MNDLISRQAAIEAVEESRRLNHHQDGKEACAHEYEHRHFLKILYDLPPVQVEQKKEKWTAINKDDPATFPNECDWVWVTGKNNDVDIFQLSNKRYWIDRDQDYVADFDWVTAWMPFVSPDPYGGDDK